MSDEDLRELERLAAEGDEFAVARLARMRERVRTHMPRTARFRIHACRDGWLSFRWGSPSEGERMIVVDIRELGRAVNELNADAVFASQGLVAFYDVDARRIVILEDCWGRGHVVNLAPLLGGT